MKNITILMLICFSVSIHNVNAACKESWRTNRGTLQPDGSMKYKDVDETFFEESNTTHLDCDNPGSKDCKFKDGTIAPIIIGGISKNWEQIEQDVQAQIASGVMSGTVNGDEGVGSYTWTAVDSYEYTLIMCDGQ